jgi:hypothetical protein
LRKTVEGTFQVVLALLTAVLVWAQLTTPPGQIKATYAGQSVTLNLTVYTPPTVLPIACDNTTIAVGQNATCTITLSAAAPVVVTISLAYQPSVSGSPSVTIPAGSLSATFTVTGVAPTATVNPSAMQESVPGSAPVLAVELLTPCSENPTWPGCGAVVVP